MSLNNTGKSNNFALVPRLPSAVETAKPGAKRILSGMVADTLALAHVGEAEAAFNRGCDYYSGNGVPLDQTIAVKYFREAAEKGHVAAQCRLGFCYEYGKGVNEDVDEALRWFRIAADQEYVEAQYSLGWCYEGVGDSSEALKWYLKAASRGNVWAQQWLGICYENGEMIVPQDYVEAAKWFRKAAEQGDPVSQDHLGVLLENGRGLAQDYAEADKWFRLAAIQKMAAVQDDHGYSVQEPVGKCPRCGNRVVETATGYACEKLNHVLHDCKFMIGRNVQGQSIEASQIRKLLHTGTTDLLEGFISKTGKFFSARLVIDSGKVVFEYPSSPKDP
jgi:tetratricopeptide (TPR) repeat protein